MKTIAAALQISRRCLSDNALNQVLVIVPEQPPKTVHPTSNCATPGIPHQETSI